MDRPVVPTAWYSRPQWPDVHRMFPGDFHQLYDEWLAYAEKLEAEVNRQGFQVVRIPFDPTDFIHFRDAHPELKTNKDRRQAWAVDRFTRDNPDS